jgi:outer membrane lipoprotein-sorting protein
MWRNLFRNLTTAEIHQADRTYFPKNQSTVSQVNMTEASGDTTNIVFKNTKINASIPASEFTL